MVLRTMSMLLIVFLPAILQRDCQLASFNRASYSTRQPSKALQFEQETQG